jgi:hypothetical protein
MRTSVEGMPSRTSRAYTVLEQKEEGRGGIIGSSRTNKGAVAMSAKELTMEALRKLPEDVSLERIIEELASSPPFGADVRPSPLAM